MKKILSFFAFLAISAGAFAQNSGIPFIREIASVRENDETALQLFYIPQDNGEKLFYLDLGTLGIGDEVLQINVDPVNRLFVPLGGSVAEAEEALNSLIELCSEPNGTTQELSICFAPLFPNDTRELAQVSARKVLLTRNLAFILERDEYKRVTYVTRANLKSMLSGLKFHHKLYPND